MMTNEKNINIETVVEDDDILNAFCDLVPVRNWIDGEIHWVPEEEADRLFRETV